MNNINIIWLGDKPIYNKYLNTIKEFIPNMNIKIWNECDIENITEEGITNRYYWNKIKNKQYAYASDYARFKILYEKGGLYIDTDVEFVKPIDDLLEYGNFLGIEKLTKRVASGVIMYFKEPYHPILKKCLEIYDEYQDSPYIIDGNVLMGSLIENGYTVFNNEDISYRCGDITIYDSSFFCPFLPNENKDKSVLKNNTRAIHHYTNFWVEENNQLNKK